MSACINLNNVGKQYEGTWIFNHLTYSFTANEHYHIAGSNGSGKSTLLKLLAGYTPASKGSLIWEINGESIPIQQLFPHLAWCTPFTALYTDLSLRENYQFYSVNKRLTIENFDTFLQLTYLEPHADKKLQNFSSGMLQRVKLAFAMLSDVSFCFLDEPCSNLDDEGVEWYQKLITNYSLNKVLCIASNNNLKETFSCTQHLTVLDYKSLPII